MPTTMTETPAAASSSNGVDRKQLEEQFENLMSDGKRCFHCGEHEKAVENFEEACKVKTELCGENSHELAHVYYYYGSALLDLGRQEQGVLGDKVVKEDDLADDDDSDGAAEPQVEDNEAAHEEGGEEEEEEEDVTNMQIAWEMLELARTYFQRKDMTDDVYKMIAKCLEKLGDWGLENESYDQTITNMTDCIEIYEKLFPASDRRFASAYYCLGVAHCELKNFKDAQESMNKSLEVLQQNIQALNEKMESCESDEKKTASLKEEMSELNGLMTEIKHKLEDMGDLKKAYLKSLFSNGASSSASGSSSGAGSSTSFGFNPPEQEPLSSSSSSSAVFKSAYKEEKAADISHLIRRKRSDGEGKPSTTAQSSEEGGSSSQVAKKRRIQLS